MMKENQNPHLPLVLAELIKRVSPEEQKKLVSYLSWEQLKAWEDLKSGGKEAPLGVGEPEIYVEIHSDAISFEVPPGRMVEFIFMIASISSTFLKTKEFSMPLIGGLKGSAPGERTRTS